MGVFDTLRSTSSIVRSTISVDSIDSPSVVVSTPPRLTRPVPARSVKVSLLTVIDPAEISPSIKA